MKNRVSQIADLKNLGPKCARILNSAGYYTLEDIKKAGPVKICEELRKRGEKMSLNMAYALQGALMGIPWNALPPSIKENLKREVTLTKGNGRGQ